MVSQELIKMNPLAFFKLVGAYLWKCKAPLCETTFTFVKVCAIRSDFLIIVLKPTIAHQHASTPVHTDILTDTLTLC